MKGLNSSVIPANSLVIPAKAGIQSKFIRTVFILFIFIPFLSYAKSTTVQEKLAALEVSSEGHFGISALNTANNMRIQYHANERFPFFCTAKVMGVAAILKKSMTDPTLLQQKVMYSKKDLVTYSPITEKHVASGMTIEQLCEATITVSDNTAMNLLMKNLGGPQAVDAFARSMGDNTFNLVSWWPEEATATLGDVRDTTTPAAMEKSLQRLALGNVLAPPQREQLLTWLKNNKTGDARIRAGVPKGWVVGDKTGTGDYYGATNDIAIIWPVKCAPIVVVIYYSRDKKNAAKREDVLASATRILISEFAKRDQCIKSGI